MFYLFIRLLRPRLDVPLFHALHHLFFQSVSVLYVQFPLKACNSEILENYCASLVYWFAKNQQKATLRFSLCVLSANVACRHALLFKCM